MKKTQMMKAGIIGLAIVLMATWAVAGNRADIVLPAPHMDGGKPLMQAFKDRKTTRTFSRETLPPQVLSDLLWAACGINRSDSRKRTAPSARNWQEVEVYAVMADGAYRYDAADNMLRAVVQDDLRALTGVQLFVSSAPLNLVYVANESGMKVYVNNKNKMKLASPEDRTLYAAADTGFISQNVYLFCASEGLATVVRGSVKRDVLAKALNLSAHQKIILCQTVGYPEGDD